MKMERKEKLQGVLVTLSLILLSASIIIIVAVSESSDTVFYVGAVFGAIFGLGALLCQSLSIRLAKEIDGDRSRMALNRKFKKEMSEIEKAPDGRQTVQGPIKGLTVYYIKPNE